MPRLKITTPGVETIELHYQDAGRGRPVVLIHGWPLSSRAWEPQVPALVAAGYRVITYDRRGFGQSSQPWSGYDYDTFANDLHALVTELDLHAATLVGFSMGGGEVARYVARHGRARLAQAVFACAVPPFLLKAGDNEEGGVTLDGVDQMQGGVRADRLAFLDDFTRNFFSVGDQLLVSEAQRRHARDIAAFASPQGTHDCIRAFSATDFRADLATFGDLPCLVLHGDADAIVPFEVSGARTLKALRNATLALVAGAPHGFNLSHAAEFNRHLVAFLQAA